MDTTWPAFAFVADWAQRPYFRGRSDGEHLKGHFQGRTYELDQLKQFFTQGSGGTILVSGHRGVGKTATVDRALIEALDTIDAENNPRDDKKQDRQSRRRSYLNQRSVTDLKPAVIADLRSKQLVALKLDFGQIATLKAAKPTGSKSHAAGQKLDAPQPQPSPDSASEVDPRQVLIEIIKGLHRQLVVDWHPTKTDKRAVRQMAQLQAKMALAGRARPIALVAWLLSLHWFARFFWPPHRRFWWRLTEALNEAMIRAYHQTYREEVAQGVSRELVSGQTSKWTFDYKKLLTLGVLVALFALGLWYGIDRTRLFEESKELAEAAAVLVGLLGIAGSAALSTSRTMKSTDAIKVVYSRDSSVPSLKRDVEEILGLLESRQSPIEFRLVVVLDELDKLEDVNMLDSVIKSFKNLFTLNNCTFVFLTDKSYFDHITIQQQDAAKKRTYATQHTFFTRKIFLTKPDFDDVRQYLDAVSLDRDAIRADPDRSRDWEQIVRYLAFASRCHYFDLISLVDELLQATAPPTLKLTYERLTRVDVKSNADFQRMVELVYRQYRYVERNRSHANNRLLAELYSIFDPQDAHPHTNGRVNGATSTEKEVEISVEEQAKQKKAKEELVKLLRRYGAIDSQNGNGATDLRLRLVASREPRAEDLDLDEQTRTSISNLRQTIGAARAIDEMLGKV